MPLAANLTFAISGLAHDAGVAIAAEYFPNVTTGLPALWASAPAGVCDGSGACAGAISLTRLRARRPGSGGVYVVKLWAHAPGSAQAGDDFVADSGVLAVAKTSAPTR